MRSQADSGVGIKSGVNLLGKKNVVGTFVPPFTVINDRRLLKTPDEYARQRQISPTEAASLQP